MMITDCMLSLSMLTTVDLRLNYKYQIKPMMSDIILKSERDQLQKNAILQTIYLQVFL
jgi:hypothetical protein